MRLFWISLIVLFITGCSATMGASYYTRPDTSFTKKVEDYKSCEQLATKKFPERNVSMKAGTKITCRRYSDETICRDSEIHEEVDTNAGSRDNFIDECMFEKDYIWSK